MDLLEYQAKELFAKHGVPVTVGTVITTPEEAEAAAEAEGGRVVVKAQVKTGGRGKAGGVKLAQDPQDAVVKAREILGMDIKGHTVHRALVAPAADIAEEYYFSFLLDRANRNYLCIASTEGGVEIEVTAHENPDALARVPIDPQVGVDDAKAAEIVAGHRLRRLDRRPGGRRDQEALGRLHRGGRDPGRGQPAGEARPTARSRRSTARSPSTRTPTSGTRTTPRFEVTEDARPAGARGQGEGPQLRQARRRGRHHRQRRGPGHVHPRRRRLRR